MGMCVPAATGPGLAGTGCGRIDTGAAGRSRSGYGVLHTALQQQAGPSLEGQCDAATTGACCWTLSLSASAGTTGAAAAAPAA